MSQIISRRPRSVFQYHKGNVKQNLVRTVAHSSLEDEVFLGRQGTQDHNSADNKLLIKNLSF